MSMQKACVWVKRECTTTLGGGFRDYFHPCLVDSFFCSDGWVHHQVDAVSCGSMISRLRKDAVISHKPTTRISMEDPPFENTNREDVWVDEISDNTARVSVPLYGKF